MGIRFTASSPHFLSPEYDRPTAMVELPMPIPEEGESAAGGAPPGSDIPELNHDEMRNGVVEPALTEIEQHIRNELSHLGPRPHMGKHNTVDAYWLHANYDNFDASTNEDVETGWYQAYERFNAFGTFDNKFTEQLGLDRYSPYSEPLTGSLNEDERETAEPTATEEATEVPDEESAVEASSKTTSSEGAGLGFLAGLAGVGTGAWMLNRGVDRNGATDDATGDASGSPRPANAEKADEGESEGDGDRS